MTILSDAVALTPGTSSRVNAPSSAGQLRGVICENLSPYYLTVNVAGDQHSLPAYTADAYETPGINSPLSVAVTNLDNVAGVAANLVATWVFDTDPDSALDGYPLSVAPSPFAIAYALGGETDNVLAQSAALVANGAQVSCDTSHAASVSIAIPTPAGAAGHRYVVVAAWKTLAGDEVATDALSFHSANSYANTFDPRVLLWTIPARGPVLQLALIGDDAQTVNVTVLGTSRAAPNGTALAYANPNCTLEILRQAAAALAGGASVGPLYVPPVASFLNFWTPGSDPSVQISANAVVLENLATIARAYIGLNMQATANNQAVRCPLLGLELTGTNTDAAAHNFGVNVFDASAG